jgi:hypothetical protein
MTTKQYAKLLKKAQKRIPHFMKATIKEAQKEYCMEYVEPNTPVLTGRLRSNWTWGAVTGSAAEMSGVVKNDTPYASVIEHGEKGYRAQRYMARATMAYRPHFKTLVSQRFHEFLEKELAT